MGINEHDCLYLIVAIMFKFSLCSERRDPAPLSQEEKTRDPALQSCDQSEFHQCNGAELRISNQDDSQVNVRYSPE